MGGREDEWAQHPCWFGASDLQKKPRRSDTPCVPLSVNPHLRSILQLLHRGAGGRLSRAETAAPACPLITPLVEGRVCTGLGAPALSLASTCLALVGRVVQQRVLAFLGRPQSVSGTTETNLGRTAKGNACLPPSCVDADCHLMVPCLCCHNLGALCTSPLCLSEASACLGFSPG